ncbi:N-acetyltransferase [Acinetobacter gyllenbergii]|nr:ribosomal-protein-alanine acetyltransferase [Acinetobacter gyllenbergii CIP 110306 = MTCC 11365]GMA11683.1 N-acetyltransferase [Acinetobacter gyllenbergii]
MDVMQPLKRLETERLILNSLDLEDAAFVLEIFSNAQVLEFYDLDAFSEIEQAEALIHRMHHRYHSASGFRYAIRLKTGQMIGGCGVNRILEEEGDHRAIIGYDLHPDYWGNGYMLEAITAMLNLIRTELLFDQKIRYVDAQVMQQNLKSQRLLQKLEFHQIQPVVEMGQIFLQFRLSLF